MPKYELTATAEITVDALTICLDEAPTSHQDFLDAARKMLNKRLMVLDIKGAVNGDDGIISEITVTDVTNWNRIS